MIDIQYINSNVAMSGIVADIVECTIKHSIGPCKIAFPTGNTPIEMYANLVLRPINWENTYSFQLDEYVGLPNGHPELYTQFMYEHLYSKVNINQSNIFSPMININYDNIINTHGGLDLAILGLGHNGHIAFNEPGSEFNSVTRQIVLEESTRVNNSKWFKSLNEVPTTAMTMGLSTIMSARHIVLMVQGINKFTMLKQALWGKRTENIPCSVLQTHSNIKVLYCD